MAEMADLAANLLDGIEHPSEKMKTDIHAKQALKKRSKLEEVKFNQEKFERLRKLGSSVTGA